MPFKKVAFEESWEGWRASSPRHSRGARLRTTRPVLQDNAQRKCRSREP